MRYWAKGPLGGALLVGPQVCGSLHRSGCRQMPLFHPPTAFSTLAVTGQSADLLALILPVLCRVAPSLAFSEELAPYTHPFVLILSLGPCSL